VGNSKSKMQCNAIVSSLVLYRNVGSLSIDTHVSLYSDVERLVGTRVRSSQKLLLSDFYFFNM
jgi:hypothetical protein